MIAFVNYLNLQWYLTLNYLLIDLELAHETLKNKKTHFNPAKMAKARRALLKNNHLHNCDYFAIVSPCLHFTKLAKNPTTGLVYALSKLKSYG